MCATEAKLAVPEPAKAPTMNPPVTRAPVVKPAASAALGSSVPRPSAKAVVPGPPPAFPPAPVAMPPAPPVVLAPLPPPHHLHRVGGQMICCLGQQGLH